MRNRFFILLICVFAAACNRTKPEPDPPGYEVVIPDDVPEHLVLEDKHGVKTEGNGREMYADFHRYGWRRCWEEHHLGRIDPKNERACQDYVPQCYGIEARGFEDGFKACQRYIRQKP
jgi:hypothetical protein